MTTLKEKNRKIAFLLFLVSIIIILAAYFYTVENRKNYLSAMVKYHTRMIKLGNISSLVELGKMYEKGEGVKKDLSKAQELFKKAINFNEYLDEIYPDYTESDTINLENEKITYTTIDTNKKTIQLKNIISTIKSSTKINKKPESTPPGKLIPKRKYVSYTKKTPSKNTITLKETSKNRIGLPKKRQRAKIYQAVKKSENIRNQKKITQKNISFKKKNVLKKQPTKKKIQKNRLQAKRSPTLYEERVDFETDPVYLDDEEITEIEEIDMDIVQEKQKKKLTQTIGSNFTTNPCATASARYIAKCRRGHREKNKR